MTIRSKINGLAQAFGDHLTPEFVSKYTGNKTIGDFLTLEIPMDNIGRKIGTVVGAAAQAPFVIKAGEILANNYDSVQTELQNYSNIPTEVYIGGSFTGLMLVGALVGYLAGNVMYRTIKTGRIDAPQFGDLEKFEKSL